MPSSDIEFLLKYAKVGVLAEMETLDPIEREELKQEYIRIKASVLYNPSTVDGTTKNKDEKPSAVVKWFKGIGDRQRAYQEKNKDKGPLMK